MISTSSKMTLKISALFILNACSLFSSPEPVIGNTEEKDGSEITYNCEASKELITVFNFLKKSNHIKSSHSQSRKIAVEVAKGCTGAAKRFIKISLLLSKAKLSTDKIVKLSTEMSAQSDESAEAFSQIFKMAYLKKYLDLDALSATNLAVSLSIDYQGNPKQALDDYKHILKYCLSASGLAMPKPQCAKLSARIASYGQNVDGDIGKSYVENIKFLRSKTGPELATHDARKVAEDLAKITPFAGKNFLEVYKFAISTNGLKMDRQSAIKFAKNIAQYSVKVDKTPVKKKFH